MHYLNWLSLRLVFSLLVLPLVAAIVLVLLHSVFFPESYFQDLPVLLLLWLLIFLGTHALLAWEGRRRFQLLSQAGWDFLKASNDSALVQIFQKLEALLHGGLLPLRRRSELQDTILRRFFNYYAQHIDQKRYRQGLLRCLQRQIHTDAAYLALKRYLLRQPQQTMELVDLAEILTEYRADIEIEQFMLRGYLADRATHFRAEVFYVQELQAGGAATEEIVRLCLPKALAKKRTDDFAAWLYRIAWESGLAEAYPDLPFQLYQVQREHARINRQDDLARTIAAIVSGFEPRQVAEWQALEEARIRKRKRLAEMAARGAYWLQQKLLEAWSELKRRRKLAYYSGAALLLAAAVYLFLPAGKSDQGEAQPQQTLKLESQQGRFSLQVAAIKNARLAQREVDRLKKAGLDAYLVEPSQPRGWYRIRVGRFETKREAQEAGEALRRAGTIPEFFLVNYQPE